MDHDADLKVWTALQEEQPHLDEYETWALVRLTSLIGPMRCVDIPGGTPGLHDFEVDLPCGDLAAIEVTSVTNSRFLGIRSETEQRGLSKFAIDGVLSWAASSDRCES